MKSLLGLFVCIAAALAAPLSAQDDAAIPNEADDARAIALAIERGEAIYRRDQTAWHTTDTMLAAIDDPAEAGIAGWIINETESGYEAVFYRETASGFEAVWSGEYDGQRVQSEATYEPGERVLTDAEAAMVLAARLPLTVSTDYSLCSEQLNTVVMPTGREDGGLFVYLLMPQPAMDQIPFGGHFRFEVIDGEVVNHRKFANSCLTMRSAGPDGQRPVAIAVSHLLDDTPTEIHVFAMLAAGLQVRVIMPESNQSWKVDVEDGETVITRLP